MNVLRQEEIRVGENEPLLGQEEKKVCLPLLKY